MYHHCQEGQMPFFLLSTRLFFFSASRLGTQEFSPRLLLLLYSLRSTLLFQVINVSSSDVEYIYGSHTILKQNDKMERCVIYRALGTKRKKLCSIHLPVSIIPECTYIQGIGMQINWPFHHRSRQLHLTLSVISQQTNF